MTSASASTSPAPVAIDGPLLEIARELVELWCVEGARDAPAQAADAFAVLRLIGWRGDPRPRAELDAEALELVRWVALSELSAAASHVRLDAALAAEGYDQEERCGWTALSQVRLDAFDRARALLDAVGFGR